MLISKPLKGTVVYEYVPTLLNSNRNAYVVSKWFDLAYFNSRLNAGLLYSTLEEVLERIKTEQSLLLQRQQESS